jgi:site-specific recombinase XerD
MIPARVLRGLVHDYLEEVEISGKAEITAKRYGAYLNTFLDWLSASTKKRSDELVPGDVTPERLRNFRLHLARRRDRTTGRSLGPATRNLYLIALRNFLRYCRRHQVDVPEPGDLLQLAKTRDLAVRHLEHGEVSRITAAIRLDAPTGLRDRAIVEVLFGTGCRVSELVALVRRQVDLERREAEVIGKGGHSRLVLLTQDAAGWLERYLATRKDAEQYLFLSTRKRAGSSAPLEVRQVQRVVEKAARRAGIPFRISPHWFRHGRLTIVARHMGVQAAQRIAGHASLETTARYLHVTDQHLRQGYDEAERAEGGG